EHSLGGGVVDRDHGQLQRPFRAHPAQPDHPGGGLLAAAERLLDQLRPLQVGDVDQVAAVVQEQVRAALENRGQVAVVGGRVHAGAGEDLHSVLGDQRGGRVVLGGHRVGGGQRDVRAARREGAQQVR